MGVNREGSPILTLNVGIYMIQVKVKSKHAVALYIAALLFVSEIFSVISGNCGASSRNSGVLGPILGQLYKHQICNVRCNLKWSIVSLTHHETLLTTIYYYRFGVLTFDVSKTEF